MSTQSRGCSLTMTLTVLGVLLMMGPALAQEERRIIRCPNGPGRLVVSSPEPKAYRSGSIELEVYVACEGGMNFFVGVDGIGYAEEGDRLVPRPDWNPGCEPSDSDCWPSLTAAASDDWTEGTARYRLQLSPGAHELVVRHALGTDPPRFARVVIGFSVGTGVLPVTGGMGPWLVLGTALIVLGISLSRMKGRFRSA